MGPETSPEGSGSQTQPAQADAAKRERRRRIEHLKEEGSELWQKMAEKARKPGVGATVTGIAVLVAGAAWGATEAAVAAIAAYAVFRMLRKRQSRADYDGLNGEHAPRSAAPAS